MFPLQSICLLGLTIVLVDAHRVSCYYRYNQRLLDRKILQNIDCSHIIIGFVTVTSDFNVDLRDVGGIAGLKALVEQIKLPSRKAMLSIGGGGGNKNFDQMTASAVNIDTFLNSLTGIIRNVSLDGVDYDWEFPSFLQHDDFSLLLSKTREKFDELTSKQASADSEPLDLSVALPGPLTLTAGYNTSVLKRTCTFFNVMTYDLVLYSSWHPIAAFHNALYGQGNFLNPLRLFSVEVSMMNWVNLGLPADKLLLGIPTYGVAYKLKDPRRTTHLAPTVGYSDLGSNINYQDICRIIEAYPEGNKFDEQSRVPYAHDNNGTWISYDNVRSVVEKVQFAVQHGYGGIMIFSLNADDPFGNCSHGDDSSHSGFPLTQVAIATLNDALGKPQ